MATTIRLAAALGTTELSPELRSVITKRIANLSEAALIPSGLNARRGDQLSLREQPRYVASAIRGERCRKFCELLRRSNANVEINEQGGKTLLF